MNHDNSTAEPLTVAAIAAALGDLSKRFDVDVLAECDSTNTRLLALAETGAPAGTVIATRRQLAGRGRRGHSWLSSADASLTFSLLWRFPQDRSLTGLSLAVGVAVARALETLGIAGIRLKWPNDMLLQERKLAGVLIELAPGARPSAAVIGIGINLRLPDDLPEAISNSAAALADAGISLPSPSGLLAHLLVELHAVLECFAVQGFSALRQEWLARHAHAGKIVRLLSDYAAPIEGLCLGVDDDGVLLLETVAGIQRIISGEVSLRPA